MKAVMAIGFLIFTAGASVFLGQACSPFKPGLQIQSDLALSDSGASGSPEARGTKLYNTNCSVCHNPLGTSTKRDRSVEQIQQARLNVSNMQMPQILALTDAELNDIAAALRSTSSGSSANPFVCDTNALPSAHRLQRLAKGEYQNTLRDLFSGIVSMADLKDEFAQIPEESNQNNPFDRGADSMNLGLVKAQNAVAVKVASLVTTDSNRLNKIFTETCFSNASPDDACLNSFLDRFGLRVFRRPVKSTERAPLFAAYRLGTSRAESSAFLLRALLMAPNFVYHLEFDGSPTDAEVSALSLSAYELASRLSYLIINTMPDAELLAAAANNSLATDAGYRAQMNRLFALSGAKPSLRRFVYTWFEMNRIHDPAYTAAFKNGIDTGTINTDALEESLLFSDYVIFENKPLQSLLTDTTAFIKTPALAAIYGVSLPSAADGRTTLPSSQRAGLLTRVARTLSGNDGTSPILRGVAIRRSLLCESLSAPDPASLPPGSLTAPAEDPTLSTRKRFENKTSSAVCMGCHSKINPFGYALESIDSLGRYRTSEKVLNSSGQVVAEHAIDDVTVIDLSQSPNPQVNGAIQMSETIAQSQKFSACFSQRFFQFAMRRVADDRDNCLLASTFDALKKPNASVLDTIKAVVTNPEFKLRRLK